MMYRLHNIPLDFFPVLPALPASLVVCYFSDEPQLRTGDQRRRASMNIVYWGTRSRVIPYL